MNDEERAALEARLTKNEAAKKKSMAHRSAAIWACEDIPNPTAIPDVIAALCECADALSVIDSLTDMVPKNIIETARAALAKLEETKYDS